MGVISKQVRDSEGNLRRFADSENNHELKKVKGLQQTNGNSNEVFVANSIDDLHELQQIKE